MASPIPTIMGTGFTMGQIPEVLTNSAPVRNKGKFESRKASTIQFGAFANPQEIDPGRVLAEKTRRAHYLADVQRQIDTSVDFTPTVYNDRIGELLAKMNAANARVHTDRMTTSIAESNLKLYEESRNQALIDKVMKVSALEQESKDAAKQARANEKAARIEKAKTITLGIVSGFGKLSKKFMFGAARAIKSGAVVTGGTIGAVAKAELGASKVAQQMINAGVAVGADPLEVAKLGYALAPFGGNQKTATGFYAKLNQLVESELYDEASPFRKAALDYGLNITGSGRGGMATKEEMMRNLADWFQEQSKLGNEDSIARMAGIIGLDPSMVRLFSLGNEEMGARLEKAGRLVDKQAIENLDKLAQVSGEFSSRLQAASMKLLAFSGVAERVINALDKYALTPAEEAAEGIKQGGFVDDLKELGWAQSWFYSDKQKAHALGISEEQFERYKNFKGVDPNIDDDDERYMFLQDLRKEFAGMKISGTATLKDSVGNPVGDVGITVGAESVINQAE